MTRAPSATLGGQAGKDRPDRPAQASETPAAGTAEFIRRASRYTNQAAASIGQPRPFERRSPPPPRRLTAESAPGQRAAEPPRALHGRAFGAVEGESPGPPGVAGAHGSASRNAPDRRTAHPPGAGPGSARRSSPERRQRTREGIRRTAAAHRSGPPRRSGIHGRRADLQGRTRRGAARFRRLGATDLAPICGKTATPCGRRPRRSGPGRSGRPRKGRGAWPSGAIPPRRAGGTGAPGRTKPPRSPAFPSFANFFHFLFLFC